MVKVQKPLPKSLSKSSQVEGVTKKKQNVDKSKKKAALAVETAAAQKKDQKLGTKKPKVVEEVEKKKVAKPAKQPTKAAAAKTQKKPVKKPLILAPPESPGAPVKAAAIKKEKKPRHKQLQKATGDVAKGKKVKEEQKPAVAKAQSKSTLDKKQSKPALDKKQPKPAAKEAASKAAKPTKGRKKQQQKKIAKRAAKLAKEQKKAVELSYELKPFNEEKFHDIVSQSKVQTIVEALKTQVAAEVKKQKTTSIFGDYRYFLQVSSYMIPSCPRRVVKLNLKHSLVGPEDDVALIVTDLQRGARFEYEPTVQHYEDLLREAGVTQRLKVVPFNQLRNDMGTYEAKRKFLNTYDYLLCDGRLSGQASGFLGKFTQKPRNVLHPVRLSKEDQIKEEIARSLRRTAYRQLAKGDLTSIPVGHHEHSATQLAENILHVTEQLQRIYPGGLANVRSLYVKIDIVGTSALPLYISMCAPPAETPYVVGPKEQRMLKLKKQANEVLAKFALTKDADFIKLTSKQVERKRELREKRAALVAADSEAAKDNDGEDTAVPAKKARKDSSSEAKTKAVAEDKDAEEVEEDEADSDNDEEDTDGDDDEDDSDQEDTDGDDDDDDDDDEDDDDEDEEDEE